MNAITSLFMERGNPEMQDRAEILFLDKRTVFVMADGAGGVSGGAQAAELFLHSVRRVAADLASARDCVELLRLLDRKIADSNECGETTGIIAVFHSGGLSGANVGDSEAWLFAKEGEQELTGGRPRKPFLGTGAVSPHAFVRNSNNGTVVVATDGLWKYTSRDLIKQKVKAGPAEKLATELVDLVRLRSGALQDDVAVATWHIQ